MSIVQDLLVILTDYHGGYRLMRNHIRGMGTSSTIPNYSKRRTPSDAVLRVTLSRLKQKGLVEHKNGIWKITAAGRAYLIKMRGKLKLPFHARKRQIRQPKTMIVIFDIPETQKRKRKWLRTELKNLGFEILQKSVWSGPAPLPNEFIKSLHDLHLLPYLKFFKASELTPGKS